MPELSNVMKVTVVQCMLAVALIGLVLVIKLFSADTYEALKVEYNKMTSIHSLQDAELQKDRYLDVFSELIEELNKTPAAGGVTVDGVTYDPETFGNLRGATTAPYFLMVSPVAPVSGTVTSPFGFRIHPITGKADFHTGTDIAAPEGTAIVSILGGTVTRVDSDAGNGNYVEITHSGTVKSYYKHCSKILVEEGDKVSRGQEIALVGSTGVSTGPHLHLELSLNGQFVNPQFGVSLG